LSDSPIQDKESSDTGGMQIYGISRSPAG